MTLQNQLYIHPIDQINTQERVMRLFSRSIKKESKIQALNLTLGMIDLTTLEGKDSPGKIFQVLQHQLLSLSNHYRHILYFIESVHCQ